MKQPGKMIIYNLFPLLAGKFTDWDKHLVRASEMGFNWVFVNPVQRPGISGSLYSISDYYGINSVLVDQESSLEPLEQLRKAIRRADELGLRMMVDLVVNHCAVDSDLIKLHPKWFEWERRGRIAHPFAMDKGTKVVWKDLAKFDHKHTKDKEGLFRFFLEVVKFLIELGFRGFRCDAAYQVPTRFWDRLISETKKTCPDVLFFAETLGCPPDQTKRTARAGFDYIFNSSKWWDFHSPWLMEQYVLTREIAPSISFPESHDTARLCDELKGNVNGLKQRYLFSALFSAGVMIPMGFEFGFRKKLHVVNTTPEDWEETDIDLTSFIREVNGIKAAHRVFHEDAPTGFLHHHNRQILFMWKACICDPQEECLFILSKDIFDRQHFYVESLNEFLQSGAPLADVSPENRLNYIPMPFSYDLQPGQGMVLTASGDSISED